MDLPNDIASSKILSDQDRTQLAKIETLPNETDVNDYKLMELSEFFMNLEDNQAELEITLHKLAKKHLEEGNIEQAWMCLLAFNNG